MEYQVGLTIFKPLQLFKIIVEINHQFNQHFVNKLQIVILQVTSTLSTFPQFCSVGSHLPLLGDQPVPAVQRPLHHFATNPTPWLPATVANRLRTDKTPFGEI